VSGTSDFAHPVLVQPPTSQFLKLPEGVTHAEEGRDFGVTYPAGFVAAGVAAGIKASGRRDLGIVAVEPAYHSSAVGAAVFTRNSFAAAPVVVSRGDTAIGKLTAVLMNSGNANACTGPEGLAVARATRAECARRLGLGADRVAIASTGIIGVPLDQSAVVAGIAAAADRMDRVGGIAFADSIITTDRFPKSVALDVRTDGGVVRLGACAKGAGMIAPGMATMLCVVTTDALIPPKLARTMLDREVGHSFNLISVDGQMSTNDCVFFMANGASGVELSAEAPRRLGLALRYAMLRLALMMVADGEGATKVVHLVVDGAPDEQAARVACRAVADSTLVKTAMYGGDPNWGRILSAVGAALPGRTFPETALRFGDIALVESGVPVDPGAQGRARLQEIMSGGEIEIGLHLGHGDGKDEVFFSDLGHEYVTINAEYHT